MKAIKKRQKKPGGAWKRKALALVFWLLLWELLSLRLPEILFAGPFRTLQSLWGLLCSMESWHAAWNTFTQIAAGFALAFLGGLLLGVCGHWQGWLKALLAPAVQGMKSVPVACFVIAALIWVPSQHIAVLLSAFVVFPLTYQNVCAGLSSVDRELLEMAQVFRVPPLRRLKYLYIPQLAPYVLSSCRVSVGMCWKAGIAGEIIGLPQHSIGEQLYLSKLYLDMGNLFAWTLIVVGVSMLTERLVLRLIDWARAALEGAYGDHF